MTYRELLYKATRLINNNKITIGEYEEMTKPLDREVEQESKWIPVKTRKLTHAEEQDMLENSDYYFIYAFDCRLPEDGEEVLITTSAGEVTTTIFCNEGLDGSYFECYEDNGDVIAWMPLPEPYKGGE